MTNIERLTERLNRCKNPRLVFNAAMALGPMIRETRTEQEREALLKTLEKGDKHACSGSQ